MESRRITRVDASSDLLTVTVQIKLPSYWEITGMIIFAILAGTSILLAVPLLAYVLFDRAGLPFWATCLVSVPSVFVLVLVSRRVLFIAMRYCIAMGQFDHDGPLPDQHGLTADRMRETLRSGGALDHDGPLPDQHGLTDEWMRETLRSGGTLDTDEPLIEFFRWTQQTNVLSRYGKTGTVPFKDLHEAATMYDRGTFRGMSVAAFTRAARKLLPDDATSTRLVKVEGLRRLYGEVRKTTRRQPEDPGFP